jgi:hypothetical protein
MQFKRTAVRTIIASRILASAAGQAKTALINATAGPARSPAAASAIAPLSVLSGLKSFPKAARPSSAVGIGKHISAINFLGGLDILRNRLPSMRRLVQPIAASLLFLGFCIERGADHPDGIACQQ